MVFLMSFVFFFFFSAVRMYDRRCRTTKKKENRVEEKEREIKK
jgi:hypothetical protein